MGWIRCIHCEKLWCDFVARTSSLIAPVQPILHRVPCSIETLPNALKCYETQQNESLGSTLLDRVCSLRKIPRRLHGTNLSINCTGSIYFLHQVSCSNERLPNTPKHYETHQNRSLGSNWVIGCIRYENFQCDFMPRTCALILPFSAHFASSFVQ